MSRFYHTILCLATVALLASCQLIYDDEVIEDTSGKQPVTFVLQTRAGVDINPIVQSVRLFIFQNGVCMANRLFSSSDFTVSRNAEDSGTCDVAVNEEFTLKAGSKYDLYAVMNESGYMSTLAEGGGTLAAKLASVSEGKMNYREFLDILDTKLAYDPTTALDTDEQPFVMLSYIKDYTFTPNPAALATPVTVRMTDEGSAPRPMALLHLDKITSEASAGETATDLDLTSKVFVLDVKLVNVPDGYYFNSGSAGDGTTPSLSDVQIGSANADGYYTRTWPGTIHENVSGTIKRMQYTDQRIYRNRTSAGKGCWDFLSFDATTLTYDNPNHADRTGNTNSGNIDLMFSGLPAYFESALTATESDLDGLTRGGAILSPTSWNINVDKTLYIPENISATSNSTATTGFVVRLALSAPELDLSAIPSSFWESRVSSSAWVTEDFYSYGERFYYVNKDVTGFMQRYARACWATDPNREDVPSSNGRYKFFIGNLSRLQSATFPSTSIVALDDSPTHSPITSGVTLDWNIPTSGSNVVEVFVPLNNNNTELKPDANDDYSVRRNQRYNVTLHVMKSTYDNLATRAADGSTIPVTVKATIDKVTEDQ